MRRFGGPGLAAVALMSAVVHAIATAERKPKKEWRKPEYEIEDLPPLTRQQKRQALRDAAKGSTWRAM